MTKKWNKPLFMFPSIVFIAIVDTFLLVKLGGYVKPLQIPVILKVLIGMSFAIGFLVLCLYLIYVVDKMRVRGD